MLVTQPAVEDCIQKELIQKVEEAVYIFRNNREVDGRDMLKRQTLMELSGEKGKGHCSCGDSVLS